MAARSEAWASDRHLESGAAGDRFQSGAGVSDSRRRQPGPQAGEVRRGPWQRRRLRAGREGGESGREEIERRAFNLTPAKPLSAFGYTGRRDRRITRAPLLGPVSLI